MSEITRPMRAAGIVAEEMLGWLDQAHDAGMPVNFASLRMIMERAMRDERQARRSGLLALAAQTMLTVAAMDEAREGEANS